ncbi:helix-turn-helix domain-containing protein [Clostridium sp. LBM24168]
MRRKYINYPTDVPVLISLADITNYPLHWHDSIEILYVLQGNLTITIEADKYELIENDIEIVNIDETHAIVSNSTTNLVLIFHIDPLFFKKYYSDIKNMFFFTNTTDDMAQENNIYDILRTFLARITCESVQKQDSYNEEIESILIDLLYYLINNFHYLIYENEELKGNEEKLERYHRISKYIFNNYNDNITLQDIAKREFLSTDYLSHGIKDATGYSFTDLLNSNRIEEALKLLLDTDKTISQISEEVGFSHVRYFNKHFKLQYKYTPFQYRKKFKIDDEKLQKGKVIKYYELNECIQYINYYLEDYDRFNYREKITEININMGKDLGKFIKNFKNILNIGDAFDVLLEDNKKILEIFQEEIEFKYGRIFNVFSTDMCIFPNSKFYNWNRNRDVFEFLNTIDLLPLIVLDDTGFSDSEFLFAIESFLNYFSELDGLNLHLFKFQFDSKISSNLINEIIEIMLNKYDLSIEHNLFFYEGSTIDYIYDTAYMVPYIINSSINKSCSLNFLRAFDVVDRQIDLTNEVFFGYPGLINDKGIKKPSYYAYYLMNKLGNILVSKGEGYIVTKSYREYQILIYNYDDDIDKLIPFESFSKLRAMKNATEQNFSINIVNIPFPIRVTTYKINENCGSSYNYWIDMGKPKRLTKEEKQILHKAAFPDINFKSFRKSTIYNIQTSLKGYGAILILIKETY